MEAFFKAFATVLAFFYDLTGNYALAIVLLTLVVMVVVTPLTLKGTRSMMVMQQLQPEMRKIQTRYKDDRQKLNEELLKFYKENNINPLGGCLPLLVQMPVFLALYWVLVESVELRQAPWIGWVQNLTDADPYFILPVLNLVIMFLTQKLTPTPGMDPLQKKMMTFMPLIFGVMMAFFPAGLVLYWVTNGLLGLAQQWWMTKKYGSHTHHHAAPAK